MTWDRSPTHPKYRTKQHRELRAHYVSKLHAGEVLECTAAICLFGDRTLINPNGNDLDGLHLGHEDDGVTYRGPQHRACNIRDGAVRARERQEAAPTRWVF